MENEIIALTMCRMRGYKVTPTSKTGSWSLHSENTDGGIRMTTESTVMRDVDMDLTEIETPVTEDDMIDPVRDIVYIAPDPEVQPAVDTRATENVSVHARIHVPAPPTGQEEVIRGDTNDESEFSPNCRAQRRANNPTIRIPVATIRLTDTRLRILTQMHFDWPQVIFLAATVLIAIVVP